MLDTRLEGVIEIRDQNHHTGQPYFEATLVSDDGQTLHLFEGQLKELSLDGQLEVGMRYKVAFKPFINNRWIELKITSLEPVEDA